jgi:hypothetical protein
MKTESGTNTCNYMKSIILVPKYLQNYNIEPVEYTRDLLFYLHGGRQILLYEVIKQ